MSTLNSPDVPFLPTYPLIIETAIAQITDYLGQNKDKFTFLPKNTPLRTVSVLLLQNDAHLWADLQSHSEDYDRLQKLIKETQKQVDLPLTAIIMDSLQKQAWTLEKAVLSLDSQQTAPKLAEILHRITVNPITGFPLLIIILYFAVYKFVGEFGAGTLVDYLETFFETQINPVVNQVTAYVLPWQPLQDLIANDYGIITLGIRYGVAIILPIVGTYFLMFSVLEDSGYLPRLSLMLDRLFKAMGLSGRAVIPIILGFGCDTMATMVTRTLETKRERLIATFLLALAIPCAAQWGVILGLLAGYPRGLFVWGIVVIGVFALSGFLLSQLIPGKKADFYMEIPPLRLPNLKNILKKTYVRMKWYFWEIIPLFIWASVFIWLGHLTGLFPLIIRSLEPVTRLLGLPPQAASIFLYGFFRRDYGAAGLFDLQQQGVFNHNQLVVTAIVLTLFLPCIAQFQIMLKEQGWKNSLIIVSFIFPFAFFMGFIVNTLLNQLGVML